MSTVRLTNGDLQSAIIATHALVQAEQDEGQKIVLRVHFERLLDEQRHRAIGLAKEEPDA